MLKANGLTWYLYCALFSTLVLYYVIFIFQNRKIFKFALTQKGGFLPFLPFIGTIYYLSLISIFDVNFLSAQINLKKYLGYPSGVWFGHTYMYFVDDADEAKIILNENIEKTKCYDMLYEIFGSSLLVTSGELWRPNRKYYSKSFRPNILKSFVPLTYSLCCQLVEDIKGLKQEDISQFIYKFTLNNFFKTFAGLPENSEFDQNNVNSFNLIDDGQEMISKRLLNPIVPRKMWLKYTKTGKETSKLIVEGKNIVRALLEVKKKQHKNNPAYYENDNSVILLDLMMKRKEEEIFEELCLFILAATDTTGHLLVLLFTALALHPHVQETLYEEVIEVVGQNSITNDDLPKLKYTEAVINEGLRLFTPVPGAGRNLREDIDLGTKVLPKGIDVIVSLHLIHCNPKYWKDPHKFDPTRFLPENASKIYPFSFLPFAYGPRDCLGKVQAMSSLKITVASVIRKYRLITKYKSMDDIKLTACFTLRAAHPLDCRFVPRD